MSIWCFVLLRFSYDEYLNTHLETAIYPSVAVMFQKLFPEGLQFEMKDG
jgi:hypothetical protein